MTDFFFNNLTVGNMYILLISKVEHLPVKMYDDFLINLSQINFTKLQSYNLSFHLLEKQLENTIIINLTRT